MKSTCCRQLDNWQLTIQLLLLVYYYSSTPLLLNTLVSCWLKILQQWQLCNITLLWMLRDIFAYEVGLEHTTLPLLISLCSMVGTLEVGLDIAIIYHTGEWQYLWILWRGTEGETSDIGGRYESIVSFCYRVSAATSSWQPWEDKDIEHRFGFIVGH